MQNLVFWILGYLVGCFPHLIVFHPYNTKLKVKLESVCVTSLVRSPGFEPGSSAWQADVLAKLDYDRSNDRLRILPYHLLKSVMFLW